MVRPYHCAMHIAPSQQSRIADICQRYHVRRLQLFGSAAVGQERPDSDVDLLVEVPEPLTPEEALFRKPRTVARIQKALEDRSLPSFDGSRRG